MIALALYLLTLINLVAADTDQSKKIVMVYNHLVVYSGDEILQNYTLKSFRDIDAYIHDTNVTGKFCYALSYEYFNQSCKSKLPEKERDTTQWIVANPFTDLQSNYMIRNATNETEMIRGLIFISDQDITS